jgi:hypothetical protein
MKDHSLECHIITILVERVSTLELIHPLKRCQTLKIPISKLLLLTMHCVGIPSSASPKCFTALQMLVAGNGRIAMMSITLAGGGGQLSGGI